MAAKVKKSAAKNKNKFLLGCFSFSAFRAASLGETFPPSWSGRAG
jgi:hypothetical protein